MEDQMNYIGGGSTSDEIITKECTKHPLAHIYNQVEEFIINEDNKGGSIRYVRLNTVFIKPTATNLHKSRQFNKSESLLSVFAGKIRFATSKW